MRQYMRCQCTRQTYSLQKHETIAALCSCNLLMSESRRGKAAGHRAQLIQRRNMQLHQAGDVSLPHWQSALPISQVGLLPLIYL
jgi:hypothetical protein